MTWRPATPWSRPTPAGAGSTTRPMPRSRRGRAYPRWRGEHYQDTGIVDRQTGLPPLARGAPRRAGCRPLRRGPTPAGAGSTVRHTGRAPFGEAYPRWRGEHNSSKRSGCPRTGLPPLARGAPCGYAVRLGLLRPTPAGAGSTWCSRRDWWPTGAYPRWRGEHHNPPRTTLRLLGLPPLARGAPRRAHAQQSPRRPTPAGAGSTADRPDGRRGHQAYPRWRGEHVLAHDTLTRAEGLPPLARGAPGWGA